MCHTLIEAKARNKALTSLYCSRTRTTEGDQSPQVVAGATKGIQQVQVAQLLGRRQGLLQKSNWEGP